MATQSTPVNGFDVQLVSTDSVPFGYIGTHTGRFQSAVPNIANTPQSITRIPDRLCTVCATKIPAARLKVRPNATTCVPCLEAQGDVPLLRRFDENSAQGTVETLFTRDANLERQLGRQRSTVPGYRAENAGPTFHDEYFTAATQDTDVTTAEPDEETEL